MWVGGEAKGEKAGVGSRFLQMEYGWGVGVGTHTRDGEMEWVAKQDSDTRMGPDVVIRGNSLCSFTCGFVVVVQIGLPYGSRR